MNPKTKETFDVVEVNRLSGKEKVIFTTVNPVEAKQRAAKYNADLPQEQKGKIEAEVRPGYPTHQILIG